MEKFPASNMGKNSIFCNFPNVLLALAIELTDSMLGKNYLFLRTLGNIYCVCGRIFAPVKTENFGLGLK